MKVVREIYLCSKQILASKRLDLLCCERFDLDRGVSIACSSSNVTIAPNPAIANVSVVHWLDLVSKMVTSHLGRLRL